MIVLRDIKKTRLTGSAVTIGKFDGVHKGHDLLLTLLKGDSLKKVIFTFNAAKGTPLETDSAIDDEERKIRLLSSYDPDYIIVYPFGKHEANMSPKRFVRAVLCRKLGMKRIYTGPDFRFGKKGRGDINMLRNLGKKYGFEVVVKDKVRYEGEDISSTRIRKELKEGHIKEAREMLGREEI